MSGTVNNDPSKSAGGGSPLRQIIQKSRENPTTGRSAPGGANRLYVGNLSFSTAPNAIEAVFAAVGQVREVAMPTDRETGQPRGFAFVTMATEEAAADAIERLNGAIVDGRPLRVTEAQQRAGGGGGGGRGGRGR